MSAPSSRCIGNTCLRSRSVTSTQATNARVHILLHKQPMPSSTWNQCPRSHSQTQRIVVRALITLHKQQMPAFSFRHIHAGGKCPRSHPLFVALGKHEGWPFMDSRLDCARWLEEMLIDGDTLAPNLYFVLSREFNILPAGAAADFPDIAVGNYRLEWP